MLYIPKHFKAYEICDPATYALFGEQSFQFFRPEALKLLDEISAAFSGKAVIINNWKTEGAFHWRGLRTLDCTQGAARSAHRLGAAFDFNVHDWTPLGVYSYVLGHPEQFPSARRIEDGTITTGWTHLDTLEHDSSGILVVKP